MPTFAIKQYELHEQLYHVVADTPAQALACLLNEEKSSYVTKVGVPVYVEIPQDQGIRADRENRDQGEWDIRVEGSIPTQRQLSENALRNAGVELDYFGDLNESVAIPSISEIVEIAP